MRVEPTVPGDEESASSVASDRRLGSTTKPKAEGGGRGGGAVFVVWS